MFFGFFLTNQVPILILIFKYFLISYLFVKTSSNSVGQGGYTTAQALVIELSHY